MCDQSWSQSLCPRQEPERFMTVNLSPLGLPRRLELELLFLSVLKPGVSLPVKVQAVKWVGGGPAQAERVEVG